MDMRALPSDQDHVLALFRQRGLWGAISKTNHAVLCWRDPIYRSPRELAMSYAHEYCLDGGKKSLLAYSRPFNLTRYKPVALGDGGGRPRLAAGGARQITASAARASAGAEGAAAHVLGRTAVARCGRLAKPAPAETQSRQDYAEGRKRDVVYPSPACDRRMGRLRPRRNHIQPALLRDVRRELLDAVRGRARREGARSRAHLRYRRYRAGRCESEFSQAWQNSATKSKSSPA